MAVPKILVHGILGREGIQYDLPEGHQQLARFMRDVEAARGRIEIVAVEEDAPKKKKK